MMRSGTFVADSALHDRQDRDAASKKSVPYTHRSHAGQLVLGQMQGGAVGAGVVVAGTVVVGGGVVVVVAVVVAGGGGGGGGDGTGVDGRAVGCGDVAIGVPPQIDCRWGDAAWRRAFGGHGCAGRVSVAAGGCVVCGGAAVDATVATTVDVVVVSNEVGTTDVNDGARDDVVCGEDEGAAVVVVVVVAAVGTSVVVDAVSAIHDVAVGSHVSPSETFAITAQDSCLHPRCSVESSYPATAAANSVTRNCKAKVLHGSVALFHVAAWAAAAMHAAKSREHTAATAHVVVTDPRHRDGSVDAEPKHVQRAAWHERSAAHALAWVAARAYGLGDPEAKV
mmetsp:Transcript_22022/g.68333  ORF Transcript_22022/g.68333 Transcript_22022/m.68333 type:complete len:337 (-) Transcript_22022:232-1242(-)